jgi:hypothetical protein
MAFTKGKSGNAGGKRNTTLFLDALTMEINKDQDRKRLRMIASKLLDMAEDGDIQAIKEVANRLDGTPAQTVDLNVADTREVRDVGDAELAYIATNGGDGIAETTQGQNEPDRVH